MKTRILTSLFFAAAFLSSCDPGFDEEYIIDNQSRHNLVFVWDGSWRYYPSEWDRGFDGTYPVAAGNKVVMHFNGGLGSTGMEEIEYNVRFFLLGDSVSFVVDGADTLTYYASDTLGADSPYNFKSTRYSYDELRNGNNNLACYASLTFTVDDTMLEQARNHRKRQ